MMTINCGGKLIDFEIPKIAGILNITPDSFYDGGKYISEKAILNRVETMFDEGADMIDIGAFSSRPGAEDISEKEEADRLFPALSFIRKNFPDQILSVDTVRSTISRAVVSEFGVDIINDISGGDADSDIFATVAELGVPYIMMHMRGTPKNMQAKTDYKDIVKEIIFLFSEKIFKARSMGVNDIIVDPGFGFSKTIDQNYYLLNNLQLFKFLEVPILAGISRKSMMWKYLNTTPDDVLPATIALHMTALQNGADILRVHDVKEAVQAVKMFVKLRETQTV